MKSVLFDVDGVIIKNDTLSWAKNIYFDCGIRRELLDEFFEKDFESCLIGAADLKAKLSPWLYRWRYKGNVDDFLKYWFEAHSEIDSAVIHLVTLLRREATCYLATNQETYRTQYLMKELRLGDHFADIYAACQLKAIKPSAEFYRTLLTRIKNDRGLDDGHQFFFIDDNERNVIEARRHGLTAFHYTSFETLLCWLKDDCGFMLNADTP